PSRCPNWVIYAPMTATFVLISSGSSPAPVMDVSTLPTEPPRRLPLFAVGDPTGWRPPVEAARERPAIAVLRWYLVGVRSGRSAITKVCTDGNGDGRGLAAVGARGHRQTHIVENSLVRDRLLVVRVVHVVGFGQQ